MHRLTGGDDDSLDLGIGPAVFKVWDAIRGGWFVVNGKPSTQGQAAK